MRRDSAIIRSAVLDSRSSISFGVGEYRGYMMLSDKNSQKLNG